ncbi:HAMP domain-containing histidine kinase [Pseudoalteromonas sp. NBT06-2]|uniref:sensor histidine kinase n=1 Tax=Pseudoalteromonas sp. NBT06-2 TaxID=2025950 RepID=UPI000BA5B0A4|nr:HAMP domain-containing sensor histidine kinase [Pseudoalteromonas sp. NBT06-2]PAJ73699.1 HAMP domain-containing histidine kinase [Pseudoalteromonas sp. NBT06-2]
MPRYGQTISIKKALIRTVILITAFCLFLSVSVSTYLDIAKQRTITINKLTTYADIIAFNAQVSLLFDDENTENKRLIAFRAVKEIKNIHIYKIDDFTNETSFFTSYNAPNTPPIPVKINKIKAPFTPESIGNHIDVIRPIMFEGIIQGYVYIRGDLSALNAYIKDKLIIDISVAFSVLIVVFILSLRIQRQLSNPIERLSTLVQGVSKNKNYDIRAPHVNVLELNQLSHSLNVLFSRTQAQLERQKKDEQEIRLLNQNLEEKVNLRTIALKEANQELLNTLERMHQYQNQIVENEKMASLGQMVAGVAHEVNTPIGLGVTGSTLLKDKLTEIKSAFDNKTLTSKQLSRFIDDGIENLELVYRSLNRAAELISSFKQVDVNQDTESYLMININDLINEVLLSMKKDINLNQHQIIIECPESLYIQSKAEPLRQILENLIENSLIHAFDEITSGIITIKVVIDEGQCQINYTDNGKGVPRNIRNRIFDPFVTTRRGEGGSGLGMHLVYNLVTQAIKGRITLNNTSSTGVNFIITFPIDGRI